MVRGPAAGGAALCGGGAGPGRRARRRNSGQKKQKRPNIVLIMDDDQSVNLQQFLTKTNAAIAAKGVTFDNSFVNYSLCCPSRSTMLTGQYAHNHGVRGNQPPTGGYSKLAPTLGNTLPVWLQRAGYYTAHIGKFLNGYGTTARTPRSRPAGTSGTARSTTPTASRAAPTPRTATRSTRTGRSSTTARRRTPSTRRPTRPTSTRRRRPTSSARGRRATSRSTSPWRPATRTAEAGLLQLRRRQPARRARATRATSPDSTRLRSPRLQRGRRLRQARPTSRTCHC